jgi:rhodanese-related sulfurtransferase
MRYPSVMTAAVLAVLIGMFGTQAGAAEAPRIAKDELKRVLDDPGVVVIDVRAYTDWLLSSEKIRGAVREDYRDFGDWSAKYPRDKTVVLYCA